MLTPGNYSDIVITARDATFTPGIYCVRGKLKISGNSHVVGDGVFFYVLSGDVEISGSPTVALKAALPGSPETIDASGNDWGGMLFYLPPSSDGQVTITGGSDDVFRGTVYAPGPSPSVGTYKCVFTGSTDAGPTTTDNLQFVCDSVHITGSSNLKFQYNPSALYPAPPILEYWR